MGRIVRLRTSLSKIPLAEVLRGSIIEISLRDMLMSHFYMRMLVALVVSASKAHSHNCVIRLALSVSTLTDLNTWSLNPKSFEVLIFFGPLDRPISTFKGATFSKLGSQIQTASGSNSHVESY